MKKFLVLLLGMAVAISASAGITKSPISKKIADHRIKAKTEMSSPFKLNRVFEVKQTLRTPVTEQPAGEVKTYKRTGNALYVSGQYITPGEQSGTIDLIFAADNKVWFKNILYGCATAYGDSYVYGTLSEDGTKISVPMGQSVYYSTKYSADIVLGWGTTAVSGTNITFTIDASVTEAVYAVGEDGSLTLLNSADAPSGSDYPAYEGTGIGTYWTDDNSFGYLLDWKTVLTPGVGVPKNVVVTPGITTADVTWDADPYAEGYDMRWRPWVDNNYWDLAIEDYADDLDGWGIQDADGDSITWDLTYSDDTYTDLCFYSLSYDYDNKTGLTPDNFLMTPDVNLEGELRFSIWGPDADYPDNMMVYAYVYGETEDDDAMYALFDEDLVTTTTKTEYTVNLSELFEGAEGFIVFRHYNSDDKTAIFLDDIMIGTPFADWIYVTSLETNNGTIEGLSPNTKYEVQVMGYDGDDESDWTKIVQFTTLAEPVPDVYMLGGDDQAWDCTSGTKFDYNAEDNIYTKTITFLAEYNYFGFTTVLAENNDNGGWEYIEPYRFGAVADGENFEYNDNYNCQPLDLTWDAYKAFRIPAGEYKLTVDLTMMKLIIEKVVPAHDYAIGDVNHDHAVNIADVTALIDYLLETGTVCEICADVNGDGSINIADVTALIDILLNNNN